jgi:hypothetical protein
MTKDSLANSASLAAERARFEKMVTDNELTHDLHSTEFDVGILISMFGRHSVVKLNVDMLCNQSLKPAIILVASYIADIEFVRTTFKNYNNVFLCLAPNYPLGVKWSDGAKYCQRFEFNGLAITGSDDLLSLEYLEYCYQLIGEGKGSRKIGFADLVGPRTWYVYQMQDTLVNDKHGKHIVLENLYKATTQPKQNIVLGAGRMYSKRILDILGWEIFERIWFKNLDYKGYFDTLTNNGKVYEITDEPDIAVLSIKGNWDTINELDVLKSSPNMDHKKLKDETIDKFFKTYFNSPRSLFRITT